MSLAISWAIGFLSSVLTIRLSMHFAGQLGVVDQPGGHKQHDVSTPYIGGLGIFGALVCVSLSIWSDTDIPHAQFLAIAMGSALIFLTGFVDDLRNLNFKTRFVAQAMVASIMGLQGGVMLQSLGELIPGIPIQLGYLALPFTIFATIGVINALNMIDGIDGLSGTTVLVSLFLAAIIAFNGSDAGNLLIIFALIGAIIGFLYFNLRYPGNKRARVFLGDNGSMLLGFLLAWLFIDLSQGENRSMTPVTALWIFAMPLMDTVGVMTRRIWLRKSPFRADRNHLHHLFMRAGYTVSDTVFIVALLQLSFGVIGLLGLNYGVPEYIMFGLFLAAFSGYFLLILRPWRVVPNLRWLHQSLGLGSIEAHGLFIGYVQKEKYAALSSMLAHALGNRYDYNLNLYESGRRHPGEDNVYATIEIMTSDKVETIGELKRLMVQLRKALKNHKHIQVRQYINRNSINDRRSSDKGGGKNDRLGERRSEVRDRTIQVLMKVGGAPHPVPLLTKPLHDLYMQQEIGAQGIVVD